MKQRTCLFTVGPHSEADKLRSQRKIWICTFLIVIVLLSLSVMIAVQKHNEITCAPNNYSVTIDGNVTEFCAVRNPDIPYGIALPLTAILEALGSEVHWQDETTAEITLPEYSNIPLPGHQLVLDLEKESLCLPEGDDNILFPPLFGVSVELYCERGGKELYVDGQAVHFFLIAYFNYWIDDIDTEGRVVRITPFPNTGKW